MVQAIPEGYHAVTPSFTFKDSLKAIEFYKKAFGAKALDVFPNPNGKGTMHAVIQIGDSYLMMGDEMSEKCVSAETLGRTPITMFLYVQDTDAVYKQAVEAGAKADMAVMDMFWGDRAGSVTDPFGYCWMIATHTKDLSKEDIRKGAEAFFTQMAKR